MCKGGRKDVKLQRRNVAAAAAALQEYCITALAAALGFDANERTALYVKVDLLHE
jgi:hypothetical protein